MISSLVDWGIELSNSHGLFAHLTTPSKLKTYFCGLFSSIFRPKYSTKTHVKHQLFCEILVNSIFAFQAISLVWYPNMSITDWAAYEEVWKILGFISYDSVCADLKIMNFCFYGTGLLIAAEMIFMIIFGYFKYTNKRPSSIFSFFNRKILLLLTTVCLIPSMNIMLAIFKYSIINADIIDEYNTKIDAVDINYGDAGALISILTIIMLIMINVLSEIFSCDMKHSHYKKNIKARSSSGLDLQIKYFYIVLCIFYFSFGKRNVIGYQVSSLAISLYLLIKWIMALPYFNKIENCIKASTIAMISLTFSIFLFGEALDNSLIILVFSIFLQPIILFISIKLVFSNYKKLPRSKIIIKTQFDFERKFRHLLISGINEEKFSTLNLFKKYWSSSLFQKDKIFIIWEFNFCLSIIKDERLARIKFSKIKKANVSLEGEIQEWKLFNQLNRKSKRFPEYEFLLFLKEFSRIKFKDEDLCKVLIELQCEFSSRFPRMQKLINLVNRTAIGIEEINEGYKKIIERHKHTEAYEYYASFLEGIMKNDEEANSIKRKKSWIAEHNELNEYQGLDKYSRDTGILLISCEESNFGMIAYINQKAEQILKISAENAYGNSLSNFIPQPFNAKHANLMKKFFNECESTEIFSHEDLFFQTNDGFLVECKIAIKFTALYNSAYFLVSFEPRPSIRQIALISYENMILSHSENFTQVLKMPIKYANNKPLPEILANMNASNIQDNIPFICNINDKEILFLRTKKTIKFTSIHILLIIHDRDEIQKWKQGEDEEQLRNFANLGVNNEFNHLQILHKKDFTPHFFDADHETHQNFLMKDFNILASQTNNLQEENKNDSQLEAEPKLTSSRLRNNKKVNYSKLLLTNLKKKIRFFQGALFIIILGVVITMIAILAYIISDASNTSKMSSLGDLGQLLYDLEAVSDSTRDLSRQSRNSSISQAKKDFNYQNFKNLLIQLQGTQDIILNDFDQWSYCGSSKIIHEKLIPLWIFNGDKPKIEYHNLYDTVLKFIYSGSQLLDNLYGDYDFSSEVKFLIVNGLSYVFEYINLTTNGIVDCEINRIKIAGEYINVFIILGFLIIALFVLALCWFIILASKAYDKFWNFMVDNIQVSLSNLKASSIDRLMIVHRNEYISEENLSHISNRHHNRKLKSNLSISYISRIFIFFIISSSYYFLVYFYLYPNCKSLMIDRPLLLNNFNIIRTLLSRLDIFARDIRSPFLISEFENFYDFPNSQAMANNTLQILKSKIKEIKSENFSKLMSQELLNRIYKSNYSSTEVLEYGTDAALDDIIDEIYSLFNKNLISTDELSQYFERLKDIQDEILKEFFLADRDSKAIISSELDTIMEATIFYSIAICLLYFVYYLPYFNNEIKQLNRFAILPTILEIKAEFT